MDDNFKGTTAVELGRIRRIRRGLGLWLPVAAAAFAAVLCAGPVGLATPSTMAWFEGLACPGNQHIEVIEVLEVEVTPAETRQVVYCVDDEGQGTLAGARPFVVMAVIYFIVFLLAAFGAVAAGRWFARWFFGLPKRPLGWEAEKEARALLADGKREEAVKLVREKTGSGARWARRYVEVMANKPKASA